MTEKFANDAQTTLDGGIDDTVTVLNVADASAFPATGEFRIRIEDEYMLVTGVNAEEFTVERAAEGSVAAAHADTSTVTHVLTAGGLEAKTAGLSEPLIVYDRYGHPILKVRDDDHGTGDPDELGRKVTVYSLTPWDPDAPDDGNIEALEYEQQSANNGGGQTITLLRNDGNTAVSYQVESGNLTLPDPDGISAVLINPLSHKVSVTKSDGGDVGEFIGSDDGGFLNLVEGMVQLTERPVAPGFPGAVTDGVLLYTQDLGGKTALYAQFPTGSPVKIAEEP